MAVTVASTSDLVAMIEAGAKEVTNDEMFDGIMFAHKENQRIVEFIKGIQAEVGKKKIDFPSNDPAPEMYEAIKDFAIDDIRVALDTDDKRIRDERLKPIYEKVHEKFDEIYPDEIDKIEDCLYKTQKYVVRRWLLDDGKRVDGRGIDEIRPLAAEIDLLDRVHGSGMFTRGQTQVLTVTTLGPVSDSQILDGIDGEDTKRYMHHYNFPSYSVGETKPSRGPGRREIGHGALAERALLPVISEPRKELSKYAPKILTTKIDTEKIGDVIGKQGKVIQKICAECNCKVDVEEDGTVFISAIDIDDAKRALNMVETIANDPEVGAIYKGVVTRLMDFGAFVEIAPGKEGLVHISHLDVKHVDRVEDVVAVGDEVIVKVREIDDQGRLNLSRRDALIEVEGLVPENDLSDEPRRAPRRDNRGGRDGGRRDNRGGRGGHGGKRY